MTSEPTTTSASETASSEPTSAPTTATSESSDSGSNAWLWWLLAALVLAAAVAIPLIVRARRRSAWKDSLTKAEDEVAWFSRGLVPDLRRLRTPEQVSGAWSVAAARVSAAEDRLTSLVSSAPNDEGRTRATQLRDAVRASSERLERLTTAGAPADVVPTLDAVSSDLEGALNPQPAQP